MNLREDGVLIGIITGILVPVLAYGLLTLLFTLLTQVGIMDPTGFSESWRLRTIALLAICANLVPFQMHKGWHNDQSMRGLIFPTILFVAIWVFYFKADIFQQ